MRYSVLDRRAPNGPYNRRTARWLPNYRSHQSWGDRPDLSRGEGPCRAEGYPKNQRTGAGSAGARGHLLRDRAGAVYAVVVSRSVAVPAGRSSVVAGAVGESQSSGQFRHIAGANQTGMGAVAATAR